MVNTETVSQRTVDFKGFARNTTTLIGTQRPERAHVMRAVCQLDENDTDVFHHRHDHFAEVFSLSFFFIAEVQFV